MYSLLVEQSAIGLKLQNIIVPYEIVLGLEGSWRMSVDHSSEVLRLRLERDHFTDPSRTVFAIDLCAGIFYYL